MSLQQKVSSAIRILRWNRDVSARASHLVEVIHNFQAGSGNVSGSTVFFERKLMSTKTSIKRIAAVAAVALTLGGFSAVSAHAGENNFNTESWVTSGPVSATTGVAANLVLSATGVAAAGGDYTKFCVVVGSEPVTSSKRGDSVTVSQSATGYLNTNGASDDFVTSANWGQYALAAANWGQLSATNAGRSLGYFTASFTADVAGDYTLNIVNNCDFAAGATYSIKLTATAQALNHATSYIGATSGEVTADVAASSRITTAAASNTAAARIDVRQYSSVDTATAMVIPAAVTVAISGAGLVDTVSGGGLTRGPSSTATAAALQSFVIFPDGRAGTATITVSIGGVVVSTKTHTFVGTASKYVFDTAAADGYNVLGTTGTGYKAYIPVAGTGTLTVTASDANGNPAAVGTIATAKSDNTAVANVTITTNVSSASTAVLTVSGVAAGSANITISNGSTTSPISLVIPVKVSGTTVSKVTVAFDSDSYAPGQAVTLTASAFDSAGNPIADGTRDIWGTVPAFNQAYLGAAPTFVALGEDIVNGKITYTFFAPVTPGALTATGTDSTSAANALVASATVTGGAATEAAQAAIDAAQEATDAANAAYDAANNAMDSADAATAAAQDASDNASAALAAVTSLSATVAKLVKSVTAIATALASIKKKLGVK